MKLKMWIGNLDGERAGLVIAPSKKRAREIVGTGVSDFDAYWRLQSKVDELLEAETLYTRPMRASNAATWHQGRCHLEPKGA